MRSELAIEIENRRTTAFLYLFAFLYLCLYPYLYLFLYPAARFLLAKSWAILSW